MKKGTFRQILLLGMIVFLSVGCSRYAIPDNINITNDAVGMGVALPDGRPFTIVGDINIIGFLNATDSNITGLIDNSRWNLENDTAAQTPRENAYFRNENQTAGTVFTNENFTSNYNARTDRYSKENYTAQEASAFNKGNLTGNTSIGTNVLFADNTSGNVGIGATNPNSYVASKLVVADTVSSNGITIRSDSSGYGLIYFADDSTGSGRYAGAIRYNHATDKMEFWTDFANDGAIRMVMDSSGQVGIGTQSPIALFQVTGTTSGTNTLLGSNGSSETFGQVFNQGAANGGVGGFVVYGRDALESTTLGNLKRFIKMVATTTGDIGYITTGNQTSFAVTTGDAQSNTPYNSSKVKIYVSYTGNVGLGGIPVSNAPIEMIASSSTATTRYLRLFDGSLGDLNLLTANNAIPAVYIKGTGTADLMRVMDNTVPVFTILDGGSIGVNNSAPKGALDVRGKAFMQSLYIGTNNGTIPITENSTLKVIGQANFTGTVVYGALQSNSPQKFSADESGYTRICTIAFDRTPTLQYDIWNATTKKIDTIKIHNSTICQSQQILIGTDEIEQGDEIISYYKYQKWNDGTISRVEISRRPKVEAVIEE